MGLRPHTSRSSPPRPLPSSCAACFAASPTSLLSRPPRRDEERSDAKYTCSNRDRHAPLTPPGLRGLPSLGTRDLGADAIPTQPCADKTTPRCSDVRYGTAPSKVSPTRKAYVLTHYGMGRTILASTSRGQPGHHEPRPRRRGHGPWRHNPKRRQLLEGGYLLPHCRHDTTRKTGEHDTSHDAYDSWPTYNTLKFACFQNSLK
jgi:hypothetical protein